MKKMLLATALKHLYYGMCSTDVYCSKQTGSSSTKGNHHPSFLRFWNWAEENCRCSQNFVAAQKMLLKQTQQTFVNGLLSFYYFRHLYSAGSACIIRNNCMSCPSIWAALSTLLANILLGSFQLFLHSDQPLSGGDNPVQRCLPVGGRLHYPRRRRWCFTR